MKEYALLDEYLGNQHHNVHQSSKKLLKVVREAYPIGIPALIMKSTTDRIGISAGYSFHLGTPDGLLRRLASWLITKNNGDHFILLKLNKEEYFLSLCKLSLASSKSVNIVLPLTSVVAAVLPGFSLTKDSTCFAVS